MGTQQEADDTVNNDVGVKDEAGEEIIKSQIEALEREKKMFDNNIKDAIKTKARYEEQWINDNKIYNFMLDNLKKINPDHEYETIPEYWECRTNQLRYKYEQEKHMAEAQLKKFDKQLEVLEEQYESANTKLKELGEKDE